MPLNYIIQSDPILERYRLYMIRKHHEALEKIERARLYIPVYQANYKILHKEHLVEYQREYRIKQKLSQSTEDIEYRQTYHINYRERNKQKISEYQTRYRLKKKESTEPILIFID